MCQRSVPGPTPVPEAQDGVVANVKKKSQDTGTREHCAGIEVPRIFFICKITLSTPFSDCYLHIISAVVCSFDCHLITPTLYLNSYRHSLKHTHAMRLMYVGPVFCVNTVLSGDTPTPFLTTLSHLYAGHTKRFCSKNILVTFQNELGGRPTYHYPADSCTFFRSPAPAAAIIRR